MVLSDNIIIFDYLPAEPSFHLGAVFIRHPFHLVNAQSSFHNKQRRTTLHGRVIQLECVNYARGMPWSEEGRLDKYSFIVI